MSENKWIRPVSFNRKNKKDQERLKLVGRKAFSTFVKKLLDEEIERRTTRRLGKHETVIQTSDQINRDIKVNINEIAEQKRSQHKHQNNDSRYYPNAPNETVILNTKKPLLFNQQRLKTNNGEIKVDLRE